MTSSAILRIKEAAPLPTVAMEYLKLRKIGSSWQGLCPFHAEETPSFRVHEQFYKCFGCDAKGDVVTFVSRIEGVSASAAIRLLSDRTGIPLDAQQPRRTPLQRAYDAEEQAFAEWWWSARKEELAFAVHVAGVEYARYDEGNPPLEGLIHVSKVTFGLDGPMYEPSGGWFWEQAEKAGTLWRQLAAMPLRKLRSLAERCATAEERKEWGRRQEFERKLVAMVRAGNDSRVYLRPVTVLIDLTRAQEVSFHGK